jgi:hypothetical protein
MGWSSAESIQRLCPPAPFKARTRAVSEGRAPSSELGLEWMRHATQVWWGIHGQGTWGLESLGLQDLVWVIFLRAEAA